MGVMATPNPKTEGHIMCHAGAPDTYFAMLVYKAHILLSPFYSGFLLQIPWGTDF